MLFKRVRAALWGLGHPCLGGVCLYLSLSPFFSTSPCPRSIVSSFGVLFLLFTFLARPVLLALTALVFLSRYSHFRPHLRGTLWPLRGAAAVGASPPLFRARDPRIQGSTLFLCLCSPPPFFFPQCALKSVGSESSSGVCIRFCVPRERESCVPDLMMSQAGSGCRLEFSVL